MRMPVIPFSRANALARAANATNTQIGRGNVIRGIPGFPAGIRLGGSAPGGGALRTVGKGMKLGNLPANLSDYINSPGTPGSSTFYMYGLGDDGTTTGDTSSSDVTTSSPSFASALQSIVQSVSSAVPAVANAVTQLTAQKTAQAQLQAGQISATQYAQITGQQPPAALLPVASRIGFLAIPLFIVAVAIVSFFLMRKR